MADIFNESVVSAVFSGVIVMDSINIAVDNVRSILTLIKKDT